jgi:hypothetical protein
MKMKGKTIRGVILSQKVDEQRNKLGLSGRGGCERKKIKIKAFSLETSTSERKLGGFQSSFYPFW